MPRPKRPDLSDLDPLVLNYIAALEAEINHLTKTEPKENKSHAPLEKNIDFEVVEEIFEPAELPSTQNLITVSQNSQIKRTPRHQYLRQRRGGMGVFDIETYSDDQPILLAVADEIQSLLIFTNYSRVFRLPINKLPSSAIRSRGESLRERFSFEPGEYPAAILPTQAAGYVALVTQNGIVRCLRHHFFGEYLKPGTSLFNFKEVGSLASACWTSGDSDLLIASKNGMAIRFSEKLIPPRGETGIRMAAGDFAVSITSVNDDSKVFILGSDGKGIIRLMAAFAPNKTPGGSGKNLIKVDKVVSVFTVENTDDIFIISKLQKLIRFRADEVSVTESVVHGVNCINLRGDEAITAVRFTVNPH
jgi:DNA gyrase subunit A